MISILSGLPASGKTTQSLAWVAEDPTRRHRVNYDDIRVRLYGCKGPSYFQGKDLRKREASVKEEAESIARAWLTADPIDGTPHSVVIDNCNLTTSARMPWEMLGRELGVPVTQQDIDTPIHECVRRDRARTGDERVGRCIIERMSLSTGWIDWKDELTTTHPNSNGTRQMVVVDIDGTLSDPTHRLHHVRNPQICVCGEKKCPHVDDPWKPRWDLFHAEVHKDGPKIPIIELVRHLATKYCIVVVSGRSPEYGCGIKTEDWLDSYLGPSVYSHVYMRAAGDHRPDFEHKQAILDLLPKDRIAFVLDDRQQVVDMWRKNGLTVLQVSKGDF